MESPVKPYFVQVILKNIPRHSSIKQIFTHSDFSLLLTNDGSFYGRGKVDVLTSLFDFGSEIDNTESEEDYLVSEEDYSNSETEHVVAGTDYIIPEAEYVASGEDHTGTEEDYVSSETDYVISEEDHAGLQIKPEDSELDPLGPDEENGLQDFTLLSMKQELRNIHIQDFVMGEEGYIVILTSDNKLYVAGCDELVKGKMLEGKSIQKIVAGTNSILVLTGEGKL